MKLLLKIFISLLILFGFFVTFVQVSFSNNRSRQYKAKDFSIQEMVKTADVELGKRLYTVRNGCIECHGADLSGAKIMENGAMGSIFGSNISPFKLKDWSDEEIARAIRYGIHKSGRSLVFMPSFDFEAISMGDTAALVAYIRSVPAVEKESHTNTFGPIAKMLSAFGKIPVMFPAKIINLQKGFSEKPPEGPTVEFGKYLTNACIGCHGEDLKGGKIQGGDPSWPEAPNIRLGAESKWNENLFKEVIKTGVSPISKNKLRAPMPVNLLAQMNEEEIQAIWLYLSSLK